MTSRINAEKGRIELPPEGIASGKLFALTGEWEFYRSRLFTPEDFRKGTAGKNPGYFPVPLIWNAPVGKEKTSPHGFATYRLIITLKTRHKLSIYMGAPMSAYRLWINGKFRGGAGEVGTSRKDSRPGMVSRLHDFDHAGGKTEIIFQVANFEYARGGVPDFIIAGSRESMHYRQNLRFAFSIFLLGILLIVGLYNFAIVLIRRKERAALWFGIFAIFMGIRVMLTNDFFITTIIPGFPWELLRTLEYLTVPLGITVFLRFLHFFFPGSVNRKFFIFIAGTSAVYSLIILFTPARIFSQWLPLYHIVFLFAGFYCAWIFISSAIKKREGALVSLAGFGFLFLTTINDVLLANAVFPGVFLVQLGFIVFILTQSLYNIGRFSQAFARAEEMSENLEKKVKERTRELEQERNRFKIRNETMERELSLARRIQEQLIPHPYPSADISSLYKPMDQVGGDFYDFLKFRNSSKVGLFLSDVSGHGVPAAFITSMVKTLILQSGPRREDPAELLSFLNRLLINQTGGNFITAFYGILDRETRSLTFANAGHHAPVAITGQKIYPVNGARSIPLAVMDNEMLEAAGKIFQNSSVTLEKESKLVLYTDGLTETTREGDSSIYFEEDVLYDAFSELRGFSSKEFVERLIGRLIEFHGSSSFDDDICLVCVDVL